MNKLIEYLKNKVIAFSKLPCNKLMLVNLDIEIYEDYPNTLNYSVYKNGIHRGSFTFNELIKFIG